MARNVATTGKIHLINGRWEIEAPGGSSFRWYRDARLRWEETPAGWMLIPDSQLGGRVTYLPSSDLFRNFAALALNKEAIARFAEQYGLLGLLETVEVPGQSIRRGEPFSLWQREILAMRAAVAVWEAIRQDEQQEGGGPALVDFVHWRTDGPWVSYQELGAAVESLVDGQFHEGDVMMPARAFVAKVIREHLRPPSLRFEWVEAPSLYVEAASLLGFLWHHFAAAVAGNIRFGCCPVCGTFFEIPPKARDKKRFCGRTCKNRHNNEKRKGGEKS